MANICTNYLSIADYDNEKKNQILELLNKDRDATFELLKTGMPEFRIYDDDFGTAYCEKGTNEINLSFLSAWGGNPREFVLYLLITYSKTVLLNISERLRVIAQQKNGFLRMESP